MKLQDIFQKDIHRVIDGVIKVDSTQQVQTELEEYVVTKELDKLIRKFFQALTDAELKPTENVGIWISGFFGSWKSHFLKILWYLLANKEVAWKIPLSYFESKISDSLFYSEMQKYIQQYDCETILFNIDAIANINSRNQKNAIVEVCMKAFYRHLNFHYIKPRLAHKEWKMWYEWIYNDFKDAYLEITWRTWEEWRIDIELEQNFAAQALIKIKPEYDEESARRWFDDKQQHDQFHLSAEEFSTIISDYCKKEGTNKRVFFMIDEVWQYIGRDSQLMLNLQTVAELLWSTCLWKAWLVVTSQEALDEVTKMEGHGSLDFSKIKWRFPTQLSLSSSNVDEVIQKRLLEKKQDALPAIKWLYEKEEQHLRNMISFDGYDYKFYSNSDNFSALYPLLPYQINLVRESLHAIWNIWYAGSYLARGERSLLTFFQQTIKSRSDQDIGVLIKFSDIYDAVEWRIDSYIKQTISKAEDSDNIDELWVDILKVLFLLKYVREISLTIDNISTLLVDHIDTDMIALKKKIQESLTQLQKHWYINKRAEDYEFLSNEEQEIEHQINNITIDPIDVYNQMYDIIFENINYWLGNKYQFDKYHSFAFKKMIDEYEKLSIDSPLCVQIITSWFENKDANMFSFSTQTIRIELPKPESDEQNYREFLFKCKKIEKYLTQHTRSVDADKRILMKEKEKDWLLEKAKILIDKALLDASYMMWNQNLQITWGQVKDKLQESLGYLCKSVFSEFPVLKKAYKDQDIISLIRNPHTNEQQLLETISANDSAQKRIYALIKREHDKRLTVTLKRLQEEFRWVPYGRNDSDVSWLISEMLLAKSIIIKYEWISITSSDPRLTEYLTKGPHKEKVVIEPKPVVDSRIIRSVQDIMRFIDADLWASLSDDEEELYKRIHTWTKDTTNLLSKYLTNYEYHRYPGKQLIEKTLDILRSISLKHDYATMFSYLEEQSDSIRTTFWDLVKVSDFFESRQKEIFDSWLLTISKYASILSLLDDSWREYYHSIQDIVNKDEPYEDIPKVKWLVQQLDAKYKEVIEEKRNTILQSTKELTDSLLNASWLNTQEKEQAKDMIQKELLLPIQETSEITTLLTNEAQVADRIQHLIESVVKKINTNKETPSSPSKKVIHIKKLIPTSTAISNKRDIDNFLDHIKQELETQLKDNPNIVII